MRQLQAGSIKLLLLILTVAVLVTGGGVVWALKKSHSVDAEDEDLAPSATNKPQTQRQLPLFVGLEPFTVKLRSDQADQDRHVLQLVAYLKARDLPASERIKAYLPQIRHEIILKLMSNWRASDVATTQGMEALAIDLRKGLNRSIGESGTTPADGAKAGPDEVVQAVLFASFVVQ